METHFDYNKLDMNQLDILRLCFNTLPTKDSYFHYINTRLVKKGDSKSQESVAAAMLKSFKISKSFVNVEINGTTEAV